MQDALGVSLQWTPCSIDVYFDLSNAWLISGEQPLAYLLDRGVHVLAYAGERDLMYNHIGISRWVDAMRWDGEAAWKQALHGTWLVDGQPAGEGKEADGMVFLRMYDAGHVVTLDQPHVTLSMIRTFLAMEPLISVSHPAISEA